MAFREHPRLDQLLRFLGNEASAAERRAIVRHLLTGCPDCLRATRPHWNQVEIFAGLDIDLEEAPRSSRRFQRDTERGTRADAIRGSRRAG